MSLSSRKKTEGIFLYSLFCPKENFQDFCFISMYSILNTLSEYICFCISKNIISHTFVACFQNCRKPKVYINNMLGVATNTQCMHKIKNWTLLKNAKQKENNKSTQKLLNIPIFSFWQSFRFTFPLVPYFTAIDWYQMISL